jgi:hypothetical protein
VTRDGRILVGGHYGGPVDFDFGAGTDIREVRGGLSQGYIMSLSE